MLKFLFIILFIIPICFKKKRYWLVQNLLFLLIFFFIVINFYSYYFINLSYIFACDILSYGLIVLRIWICSLIIIAREKVYFLNNYYNFFSFIVVILLILLYITFSAINIFIFYIFFERSLIPTLFLILGWGYQPERLQAGIYLLFYTLLASLPLLIGIFYLFYLFFSL